MKKESFKTLAWIFVAILWFGVHKLVTYLVDMQYSSKVAPSQVDDDNAYTLMKTHGAITGLADYIYFAGFLVIAYFIAMIWVKRRKASPATE